VKFYSGIGSRETPWEVCGHMTYLATILEDMGYTLRSGNAEGADQAFASGVEKNAQIWLPWDNFNRDFQDSHPKHTYITNKWEKESLGSVDEFHPAPEKLSVNGVLLMARNFRQIIGLNEPDSEFLICWTPRGEIRGGTGQAIRIANSKQIPIYNMFNLTPNQILSEIEKRNLIM